MLTLVLIGLLSGIVTGLSPCILPVLPAVLATSAIPPGLSDSATGAPEKPDRRRPFIVIAGLVTSFAVFTLVGASLLAALGLPADLLRNIGIAAMILVGVGFLIPAVGHLLERPFARFSRVGPRRSGSAFLFGATFGLAFVPCAGPVLATITVLAATNQVQSGLIVLTVSFSLGVAIPLLAFALAGQQMTTRIAAVRTRMPLVRRITGGVLVATALAVFFGVADQVQRLVPSYVTAAQSQIEDNAAAREALGALDSPAEAAPQAGSVAVDSPDLGPVMSFDDCEKRSRHPRQLRGRPGLHRHPGLAEHTRRQGPDPAGAARPRRPGRLLDLLLHQLPAHPALPDGVGREVPGQGSDDRRRPLTGVRVRARGRKRRRPGRQARRDGTRSRSTTTSRRGVPTISDSGRPTTSSTGTASSGRSTTARAPTSRPRRSSATCSTSRDREDGIVVADSTAAARPATLPGTTPETYLGSERANAYVNSDLSAGSTRTYLAPSAIPPDGVALSGEWAIGPESVSAGEGASLRLRYTANTVFLVLGGEGSVEVGVDGGPVRAIGIHGSPTLYPLDTVPRQDAVLTLTASPGVSAYAFTFG